VRGNIPIGVGPWPLPPPATPLAVTECSKISPTNGGCPLWLSVGPAYRDWNDHQPPGSFMSVTQCYLAMNDTHFIRVVYSFASIPSDWMWCWCLVPHCLWLYVQLL